MSVEQDPQARRASRTVTAGVDWASEDHAVALESESLPRCPPGPVSRVRARSSSRVL